MKRLAVCMVFVTLVIFGVASFVAAAPKDDAKAMVDKAVAYWKANGKDKAIAEINNPKGQFVKGDVYLFVQTFDGVILAHGSTKGLVGKSLLELKDPNGKSFSKEMVEVAKIKGSGWVEYSWANPTTKKVQPKQTWVRKIEGENAYIACGIWK